MISGIVVINDNSDIFSKRAGEVHKFFTMLLLIRHITNGTMTQKSSSKYAEHHMSKRFSITNVGILTILDNTRTPLFCQPHAK